MGFLKRFFRNVFRDGQAMPGTSSFERLSEEELEAHLGVVRYGSFVLTDAVRPSYDLQVVPSQGYRHDVYRDEESKASVPVLMGLPRTNRCSRSSWNCWSRWAPRSTSYWRRAITARSGARRPVPRTHRHAGAQEHALRLRRSDAQRRLYGNRGLNPEFRWKCNSTNTSC